MQLPPRSAPRAQEETQGGQPPLLPTARSWPAPGLPGLAAKWPAMVGPRKVRPQASLGSLPRGHHGQGPGVQRAGPDVKAAGLTRLWGWDWGQRRTGHGALLHSIHRGPLGSKGENQLQAPRLVPVLGVMPARFWASILGTSWSPCPRGGCWDRGHLLRAQAGGWTHGARPGHPFRTDWKPAGHTDLISSLVEAGRPLSHRGRPLEVPPGCSAAAQEAGPRAGRRTWRAGGRGLEGAGRLARRGQRSHFCEAKPPARPAGPHFPCKRHSKAVWAPHPARCGRRVPSP